MTSNTVRLGIFVFLLLSKSVWLPAEPLDKNLVLRGTVLNPDGEPLPDAEVFCTVHHRSITDKNGRFALAVDCESPGNAMFLIAVSRDRKMIGDAWPKFREGDPAVPETEIKLTAEIREIFGTVTDAEGKPIENAMVGSTSPAVFPLLVPTDAQGRYRFPYHVDSWSVDTIFARKPGYGIAFLSTGEAMPRYYKTKGTPLSERKNGPFDLQLRPGRSATIKVVDENGAPVLGARTYVSSISTRRTDPPPTNPRTGLPHRRYDQVFHPGIALNGRNHETDETGLVRFDGLPNDIPEIEGGPPGVIVTEIRFAASGGRSRYVKDDELPLGYGTATWKAEDGRPLDRPDDPILIVPPPRVEVGGSVKLRDGTPVAWARIGIDSRSDVYADAKGEYRYYVDAEKSESRYSRGKPPTRFEPSTFCADSRLGAAPAAFRVHLSGMESVRVDFVLDSGVRVTGFAHDEEGKPVTNLRVDIAEFNPSGEPYMFGDIADVRRTYVADPDKPGYFECLLPPGKFRFSAREWFRNLQCEGIELIVKETDETLSVDLPLKAVPRH